MMFFCLQFFSRERQFTINLRHTEPGIRVWQQTFLDQTSSSILNLSIYTHKAIGLTFFPIRFLVFVASKGDPLQKATPFVSVSIASKVNISALEQCHFRNSVTKSSLQVPQNMKVFTTSIRKIPLQLTKGIPLEIIFKKSRCVSSQSFSLCACS